MDRVIGTLILIFLTFCSLQSLANSTLNTSSTASGESVTPKLLILLVDGFRWDYYERQKQHLTGFNQFVSEGIQVEYVEPIFPSLSYPSWTTIVTGLYPSSHNIIGNYMLHLGDDELPETVFQLKDNSTKLSWWWQFAEPLWITATKAGQKVYMANFANCDVPFEGILPTECTGYRYRDVNFKLREHLNKALVRFQHGYSLAMIYDDSIDHAGHIWGPDSKEIRLTLTHLDTILREFFMNVKHHGLQNELNVVITSDHGMTSIKEDSGVVYIKLEDYVNQNDIYKVIDYGAVVSIAAIEGKSESVYKDVEKMPGVNVYKQIDIPEDFHYRESILVHDILLVANPGVFIVGLKGEKQIPSDSKSSSVQPYAASHGYYNTPDMRTVFYAKGPAFKQGIVHPVISLTDEYQIFTHVLNLEPCGHNGTWDHVRAMFSDDDVES